MITWEKWCDWNLMMVNGKEVARFVKNIFSKDPLFQVKRPNGRKHYNLKAKTEGDAKKELENLYLKQVVGKEKKETNEGEGLK